MHEVTHHGMVRIHGNRARTLFGQAAPLTVTDSGAQFLPSQEADTSYTENYKTYDQWANESAYYAVGYPMWWTLKGCA